MKDMAIKRAEPSVCRATATRGKLLHVPRTHRYWVYPTPFSLIPCGYSVIRITERRRTHWSCNLLYWGWEDTYERLGSIRTHTLRRGPFVRRCWTQGN